MNRLRGCFFAVQPLDDVDSQTLLMLLYNTYVTVSCCCVLLVTVAGKQEKIADAALWLDAVTVVMLLISSAADGFVIFHYRWYWI
ncbi:hypothetical protein Nepgr_030445 [Nepenthes gracilis]|uniref:Uncharacterized protein n=1 Tax=Nepenthes gracilis TaxID=150966 RepID=A0AAD3Y3W0_NEPGR|nr:hypothetical protein Nepgr_030445 [Nepenthes gracilis]